MSLTAHHVAGYLRRYVEAYRAEHSRFTAPTPYGGGYPPLRISPYLNADFLHCIISPDGATVLHLGSGPENLWWIAGGPAIMADFPETRTPKHIIELLKQKDLFGKPIGIYRVVAKNGIPDEIWQGQLAPATSVASERVGDTTIHVEQLELSRLEVLKRLTFGTLGHIINIPLPEAEVPFWNPVIIRDIGFITADRCQRRFINYLELHVHVEPAAWDYRSILARVQNDVRRDFAQSFILSEKAGGLISFEQKGAIHPYIDKLGTLGGVISRFRELLDTRSNAHENIYHDFLKNNPILLDVYGEAVSRPRFTYPEDESPLGKAYVEPDFIIRLPGKAYKLVELERPSKPLATGQGQPRAEVTQAVFQIAEWRAYIVKHYDRIRTDFPGIALSHDAMVVISRSSIMSNNTNRDPEKYKELLRAQYPGIEILTYDDLLDRAQQAFLRLSALGAPAVPTNEARP